LCVTNRTLCRGDFLTRIRELTEAGIPVILREKDLTESEYYELSRQVLQENPEIILHNFVHTAQELQVRNIHLPMNLFRNLEQSDHLSNFSKIGVSVHSVREAQEAEALRADYLIAGHIFQTDCKKDLPPRGLQFLEEVCRSVQIPVYAIGGISPRNINFVRDAGASGACIMSGFMQCENITEFLEDFLCKLNPKN
ncbi:MAG: thiamine phosphate synthase, partial [Oscillospiraceae bacterium]|nr:thiamine phosphate synthase [Oscillospiraceae bacterium]